MKKLRYILACCLIALLLLLGTYHNHGFDRLIFHKITDSFFKSALKDDALSLHFTLASPEDYGITPKNTSLSRYSKKAALSSSQTVSDCLLALSKIDKSRLKKEDA